MTLRWQRAVRPDSTSPLPAMESSGLDLRLLRRGEKQGRRAKEDVKHLADDFGVLHKMISKPQILIPSHPSVPELTRSIEHLDEGRVSK